MAMKPLENFSPVFLPSNEKLESAYTLLLLHGTGGSENDLIPIGRVFGKKINLLSIKGQVEENGMVRFFKRHSEGVFDIDDLKFRTNELSDFIFSACENFGLNEKKIIVLGYSNGANLAGSLLLMHPEILAGAILIRPMIPFKPEFNIDLKNKPVLIAAGKNDFTVPEGQSTEWADLLSKYNAKVTLHFENAGHNLTQQDISFAIEWFKLYFEKN